MTKSLLSFFLFSPQLLEARQRDERQYRTVAAAREVLEEVSQEVVEEEAEAAARWEIDKGKKEKNMDGGFMRVTKF